MTVLPRNKKQCGYSNKFLLKCPSITDNVKSIQPRQNVSHNGNVMPVESLQYSEFDDRAIDVKSGYNPEFMRMPLTRLTPAPVPATYMASDACVIYAPSAIESKDVKGACALVSNITFGGKTVQFLCVDGTNLQSYQYEDPNTIIRMVNSGQLPPIVIPDLQNMNATQLSMVDAYGGSIWYCMFLWEVFGRVGLIDDSHVYLSVVNVPMANAFWCGFFMVYGSGQEPGAPPMDPLTSIDVVGHESGHGIIEALGNLEYQGESGALNESIADVLGICLEKYFDIRGDRKLFDWDLGEDFISKTGRGALRSLENPKKYEQPDTYKGTYWFDTRRQEDQGGVHFNSGVGNFFYYCAATGKKGTNDHGTNYDIKDQFEMFKLAKFIYLSLKGGDGYRKITQYSTYSQYAGCLTANVDKFLTDNGLDTKLADSVREALVAVGIVSRSGEPTPSPEEPGPEWPPTPGPEEPNPWPIPDPEEPWPPGPEWPQEPGPEEPNPWPIPTPWPQEPGPENPWPIPTPWPIPQDPQWPLPWPSPQPNPNPSPFPFPLPDWLPIPDWFPIPQWPWATSPGCGQLTTYNPNSFRSMLSVGVNALKAKFGFSSRYPSNAYAAPMARAPVRQSRFTSLRNRFGF